MPDPVSFQQLYASHPRQWRSFCYVYPVLSRRSKGLSIGVNLNPDKVCNWDCVYCQVDRSVPGPRKDVDLAVLRDELHWMLGYCASGEIWKDDAFASVPLELRRINDIAFSGDGEPTTFSGFEQACQLAVDLLRDQGLSNVKVIVLSNMTMYHRENVQRGLGILDAAGVGEIWAKLEAGSEAYYKLVDRSAVPLSRVFENIRACGRVRPIVIQSMWMKLHGQLPPHSEFTAFLHRLGDLLDSGCRIKLVQLYTIARDTAEKYATPLSRAELDDLNAQLRARFPDLPVESYYGLAD